MSDKILEAGFDHPCKQTCSGWQQGRDRGRFEARRELIESEEIKGVIEALKDAEFCLRNECHSQGMIATRGKCSEALAALTNLVKK